MIETVTLTWATGELLVSPFDLLDDDRESLTKAGFAWDADLDLYTAPWTPEREALAIALHEVIDISEDPSPFALLAGRRAEGARRRLQRLEEESGLAREVLVSSGWYCRCEPQSLWRRQVALLEEVRGRGQPEAVEARCAALQKALDALPAGNGRDTCAWRWFYRGRLRFERGEMATDHVPW